MKLPFWARTSLAAAFVLLAVLSVRIPAACAYETTRIVLPAVNNKSGYNLPELNAALLSQLGTQFRFPKYEKLAADALPSHDRTTLEKIADEKQADGVAALEVSYLRNWTLNSYLNDEVYEETIVTLTLSHYDKRTGKYGQLRATRSVIQLMSVHSGPLPLAREVLEELLNRLDPVFPRQFPGPRY